MRVRRQNMKRSLLAHKQWRRVSPFLFLALTLVLSACDQGSGNGSGSATGTTTPPIATATAAAIQLGPQPCPEQGVDLYREFKWSDRAGTLTQVGFSGLYPDLTRYQAEFEQHEVNTGQGFQQWRLSAVTTAQNFAQFVLGWDPTAPTTVVSGGGAHDARAVVLIKNPSAGGATITLSLSRLELNTNGGIWEVTDVATDGMALTSPHNAQQLTS